MLGTGLLPISNTVKNSEMQEQNSEDEFKNLKYPKLILYVQPEDYYLACMAAKTVAELDYKKPTRFNWGDLHKVEFGNDQLFEVRVNKHSLTVWKLK